MQFHCIEKRKSRNILAWVLSRVIFDSVSLPILNPTAAEFLTDRKKGGKKCCKFLSCLIFFFIQLSLFLPVAFFTSPFFCASVELTFKIWPCYTCVCSLYVDSIILWFICILAIRHSLKLSLIVHRLELELDFKSS